MLNTATITREQMVDSLYSKICPACGGRKKSEHSLCIDCYYTLDRRLQQNLYKRVGQGTSRPSATPCKS